MQTGIGNMMKTNDTNSLTTLILSVVAAYLKVSENVFTGKSRVRANVIAKQYAIYYLRKLMNLTVTEIGDIFRMDHSSISYHLKTMAGLLEYNAKTKMDIAELDNILDFKILSTLPSNEFNDYFYYIDLSECRSIKIDNDKSLVFVGYSDVEVRKMAFVLNLKEDLDIHHHKKTQLYILNKKTDWNTI